MYHDSIYSQHFNFIPRYRFEKIVKSQTERKRSASYLRKQMLHIVKRQWNNASSEKAVYEARLSAYEAFCGNAAKYETPLDSGMKRSLFRLHVFCLDKAKKNGRGEDILILQPLVPQSSLNNLIMVGFLSDCKNISVFSLYGNRENFSAQTTGSLFSQQRQTAPKKDENSDLLDFILSGKTEFQQDRRLCLKVRIHCSYNLKLLLKNIIYT